MKRRFHQAPHYRTSKRGKKFKAGRGSKKVKVKRFRRPTRSTMSKYKSLSYNQIKKRYPIHPLRDDDGDGVINKDDCRPFDRKKHSVLGEELDISLHDNFGQYGTSDSINEQVNNLKRSFTMPPPTNPKMFGDESVESEEKYL